MAGHIFKNLYLCKSNIIFITILGIISSAVCIAITAMGSSMSSFIAAEYTFLCALCYFFVFFSVCFSLTTLFTGDERTVWVSFAASVPSAARGQVLSKYCTMFLVNAWITLICFISNTVTYFICPEMNMLKAIVVFFLINVLYNSLTMPFFIRFGGDKGLAAVGVTAGVILFAAIVYFLYGDISFIDMKKPLESIMKLFSKEWSLPVISALTYITMALYYISYRIALMLYRKGAENYEQ